MQVTEADVLDLLEAVTVRSMTLIAPAGRRGVCVCVRSDWHVCDTATAKKEAKGADEDKSSAPVAVGNTQRRYASHVVCAT
jgi:hypothetical protein